MNNQTNFSEDMEYLHKQVDKIDYGCTDTRMLAFGLAAVGAYRFGRYAFTALKAIT